MERDVIVGGEEAGSEVASCGEAQAPAVVREVELVLPTVLSNRTSLVPDLHRSGVGHTEGCFLVWRKKSTNQSFVGGTKNGDIVFTNG